VENDLSEMVPAINPAEEVDPIETEEVGPTAEGRRERKKREMRERIYETARLLFLEHGFEATTVEQISETADIAQATFFNYFPNKAAVLREMTREVSEQMEILVDHQLAHTATAQQRIVGFAEQVALGIEHAKGLAREILLELMRAGSHTGEAIPYLTQVQEPFSRIICEGQEKGQVRKDLDASFLTEMVLGALNMALIGWLNNPEYPLKEKLLQATAFIGEAIEPRGVH
jgi:AcrR family transcriptional regulator